MPPRPTVLCPPSYGKLATPPVHEPAGATAAWPASREQCIPFSAQRAQAAPSSSGGTQRLLASLHCVQAVALLPAIAPAPAGGICWGGKRGSQRSQQLCNRRAGRRRADGRRADRRRADRRRADQRRAAGRRASGDSRDGKSGGALTCTTFTSGCCTSSPCPRCGRRLWRGMGSLSASSQLPLGTPTCPSCCSRYWMASNLSSSVPIPMVHLVHCFQLCGTPWIPAVSSGP